MTSDELKKLQQEINLDATSMALCLGLTTHCYRKYLYGENQIPTKVERAVLELRQINETFFNEMDSRIDARIKEERTTFNPNLVLDIP